MSKLLRVEPTTFDKNRLVIGNAVCNRFKPQNSTQEVTNYKSPVKYLDNNNVAHDFYIPAPEQQTFGFDYNYAFGGTKDESNINGMQLCYPVISQQTVLAPTQNEAAFKHVLDSIMQATIEKSKEEIVFYNELTKKLTLVNQQLAATPTSPDLIKQKTELEKQRRLPSAAANGLKLAQMEENIASVIKPIYDYPNVFGTKNRDHSKPPRIYLKVLTKGKGGDMTVLTRFKGPGNKLVNPKNYIGNFETKSGRCSVEPAIQISEVYWGAHGDTSYVASIKASILEANVVPLASRSRIPTESLLGPNTAVDEGEEYDGDCNTGFDLQPPSDKPDEGLFATESSGTATGGGTATVTNTQAPPPSGEQTISAKVSGTAKPRGRAAAK